MEDAHHVKRSRRKLPRDDNDYFICVTCREAGVKKHFRTYVAFNLHLTHHHKPPKVKCLFPLCDEVFASHSKRDRHFITTHGQIIIEHPDLIE